MNEPNDEEGGHDVIDDDDNSVGDDDVLNLTLEQDAALQADADAIEV